MTYRKMTANEIAKRIGAGELVVYVEEEYGFRQWFWFPDMTEDELMTYWEKCDIGCHFFNPSGLPGDMVPLPCEDEDNTDEALADPRSRACSELAKNASAKERSKAIRVYDEWNRDYFPNQAMWDDGFRAKNTWRAHTHMEDDSWLKKPE
jgi:hypothetical protein